ncbi:hypothetical protein NQ314_007349 [Rhamnusium bicolor]|uniref:Uncharacterized protein n=1 Tax=Rhamnusium bicolor TaxID=1586634 RepID=A0AAV8YS82_9CUCU|nr:hypothetical protein NQ314_007349 [Rhamnusium bicolor]
MGVLWRKRSLLLKLVVIVGAAWFTIAFLLYTDESSTQNRIALPLEGSEIRERAANDIVDVPDRVLPFKEEPPQPAKKEEDNGFLAPPQDMAGDMGKPVVLPANLSGIYLSLY